MFPSLIPAQVKEIDPSLPSLPSLPGGTSSRYSLTAPITLNLTSAGEIALRGEPSAHFTLTGTTFVTPSSMSFLHSEFADEAVRIDSQVKITTYNTGARHNIQQGCSSQHITRMLITTCNAEAHHNIYHACSSQHIKLMLITTYSTDVYHNI
jgi:hypothetical protein